MVRASISTNYITLPLLRLPLAYVFAPAACQLVACRRRRRLSPQPVPCTSYIVAATTPYPPWAWCGTSPALLPCLITCATSVTYGCHLYVLSPLLSSPKKRDPRPAACMRFAPHTSTHARVARYTHARISSSTSGGRLDGRGHLG